MRETDFADDARAVVKRWLRGYHARFSREGVPHGPDGAICAQLLCLADGNETRVVRLINDLTAERKEPGWSWSWYVTVAAQRWHGVPPQLLKDTRRALGVVARRSRGTRAATEGPPAPECFGEAGARQDGDFDAEIGEVLKRGKRL